MPTGATGDPRSGSSPEASRAWYAEAFGEGYTDVYGHRCEVSAAREVAWIVDRLDLRPGDRVLDLGCGAGRHSRALAACGAHVVGADLSEVLLAQARSAIPGDGVGPRFVRCDARAVPFGPVFRAVLSLFTSFGYFDAAGDRAHLASVRGALRRDGTFLLDFLNAPRVAETLVPESERTTEDRVIRETRAIRAGRVEKDVEVIVGGRLVRAWRESVRLYGREELRALFASVGLREIDVYGDLAGGPWSEGAERLVILARPS